MTPRLDDLILEWMKNTIFNEWRYTKTDFSGRHPCGYLHPPMYNSRGLIQVWSDHVVVIIGDDTIGAFQTSEQYRRYLKTINPPGSNQYYKLSAASPDFFEDLGNSMQIIHGTGNLNG